MIVERLRVCEMYVDSAGRERQAADKVGWPAAAAAKSYWQHHPSPALQDDQTKLLCFTIMGAELSSHGIINTQGRKKYLNSLKLTFRRP